MSSNTTEKEKGGCMDKMASDMMVSISETAVGWMRNKRLACLNDGNAPLVYIFVIK